ncbi:hypothetical protein EV147_2717 [Cupriavidus agavae]|uniref:Uncharacterized protein n=1 Tax=Cupriavidus agavae TaxID=1001822 RepID=A0A4Q7S3Z3_9BURK|nr:hypothetical protein EV147_2717 [Cupriavidus agavae]
MKKGRAKRPGMGMIAQGNLAQKRNTGRNAGNIGSTGGNAGTADGTRREYQAAGVRCQASGGCCMAARSSSTGIDFDVGVLQRSPTLSSGTSGLVSG